MTDLPPSPDDADADLLASLYVDGEATPDERALVEADPRIMALVEVYRAQAVALADVSPPPGLRATQLGAAMDLFDETADATADEPAGVSSLADGRRRRDERAQRGLPMWLGAAAGLVLVVGGLGFVAANIGSSDDDTASEEVAINPSSAARNESDAGSDDADGDDGAMELSAEADAMEEEAMEEEAAEESMEEATAMADEASDDAMQDDSGDAAAEAGPITLDELAGDTAADFLALVPDASRSDTDDSECAPAVRAIADTDGFVRVIFRGELAELHALAPDGAVIVSSTCEIILE